MQHRQKILIVDDRADNLFALEKILSPTGAEIIKAASGNDALVASLNHNFAVAILDVQMPAMSGYELAEYLRKDEMTRHLPIIFLSAVHSDDYHIFMGYEAGAVDFITKPFDPRILLGKVNVFLELDRQLALRAQHHAGMRKLVQVSTEILAQHSLQGILDRTADAARELTGATISACIHGDREEVFNLSAASVRCGLEQCSANELLDIQEVGIRVGLLGKTKSILLDHQELVSHPGLVNLAELPSRFRGLLGVQLTDGSDAANGFILVSDKYADGFNTDDEVLLIQLGSLVSLALQHIVDLSELRQAERELRAARDELELRISERTVELRNAYSELEQHAAQLEAVNQELRQFVFVASHDLQEPLRKIQTFGDLLQKRYAPQMTGQARDHIVRITDSANRMRQLLGDLLQYSRISNRPEPYKQLELGKIVKEAADVFMHRIEAAGGEIRISDMPVIEADDIQMLQLFQNLIGNALKFRHSGKPFIRIYSETDQESCKIFVEDNGIGFEEKYLDRIFAPFQRLHGRAEFEGTGMGLAICRKIVERHGGAITARSQPGQGSAFIITLPVRAKTDVAGSTLDFRTIEKSI